MGVERRGHVRLALQDNAFAALGSHYSKVGKIKNISHSGLAFEYITGESDHWHYSQVDIFLSGKVFYLYNIPCKLIYDIEVHIPYVTSYYVNLLTTKRCGVQFQQLDQDKRSQLNLLLGTATVGRIRPPNFSVGGLAHHSLDGFPKYKEGQ